MSEFYFWLGDNDREKPLRKINDGVAREEKKNFRKGFEEGFKQALKEIKLKVILKEFEIDNQ